MQNAECRMQRQTQRHATRNTQHASRFTPHSPIANRKSQIANPLPLLVEKIPFFVLAALASVVTFVVQQRGGALAAGESLPLGARARERADFLWPLSGEAVLAHGSGGFLSAPRAMAAGEGAAGGWVDPGHFGAGLGAAAAASLFAGGVAVVLRDAGAREPGGPDRRPRDGGSVDLPSVAWGADPRRLGRVRLMQGKSEGNPKSEVRCRSPKLATRTTRHATGRNRKSQIANRKSSSGWRVARRSSSARR